MTIPDDASFVLNEEQQRSRFKSEKIVLGKKIENPYSIVNMEKALSQLQKNNVHLRSTKLKVTDLYVRILPKSAEDIKFLKEHGLELYEYPLDYEIENIGGTFYHDGASNLDNFTWQYTVVKPDFKLTLFEHEIIEELFIPESMDNEGMDIWTDIETRSLHITGNFEEESNSRAPYYPKGRIRVQDNFLGADGMDGVKVRARRWFVTRTDYTDFQGFFNISDSFNGKVNYSIVWEGNGWDIRDGRWTQAYFNGPYQKSDWNLNISSGKSLWFAMTHESVYDHFNNFIPGMLSPKRTVLPWHDIVIAVIDDWTVNEFRAHVVPFVANSPLPEVFMYVNNRSSAEIYALASHEVAHITHIDQISPLAFVNYPFSKNAKFVVESWAEGVEWAMCLKRYGHWGDDPTDRIDNYQERIPSDNNEYTSLVVDLIDNVDQAAVLDVVSNYNISVCQSTLTNVTTWTGWRNNLQNNLMGNQSGDLHNLFSNWNP